MPTENTTEKASAAPDKTAQPIPGPWEASGLLSAAKLGDCPKCGQPLRYYDGALGYEAARCEPCNYERDLNAAANSKTAENFAEQVRTLFGLPAPAPLGDTIEEITEGRTIWNSDGKSGPCLICPPPGKPAAPTPAPRPVFALPRDGRDPESYKGNALAARVAAANRANYAVMEYARYVAGRLKPFLNQKVLKQTSWGTALTKKADEAIGDAITPSGSGEHFSISTQGHWITVRCRVDRHYEEYRHSSWEAYSTVGKTGGTDTLQALETEPAKLRIDYSEAEIRGKRQVVAGLEKQLHHAKSALEGFGEHDYR